MCFGAFGYARAVEQPRLDLIASKADRSSQADRDREIVLAPESIYGVSADSDELGCFLH